MALRGTQEVLLTDAAGFVGRALVSALVKAGYQVRPMSRCHPCSEGPGVRWVQADFMHPGSLAEALDGVWAAYYLVDDVRCDGDTQRERRAARAFARAAAEAGLSRIIYLGVVAPKGCPSEHLASRVEVGEVLRRGEVPTLELRASMIVGRHSASWQIVRDLALRLPAMVLPSWLRTRIRPIALEDAVQALVDGLRVPLPSSAWYDIPGPEELTAQEILMRVAALRGRKIPAIETPFPSPYLSSLCLQLVTRVGFETAQNLVLELAEDQLPRDERYWLMTAHPPRMRFEEAARRALDLEESPQGLRGMVAAIEETLVEWVSPRTRERDVRAPGNPAAAMRR